ncbi:MAG: hypothetical protein H6624_05030 [Bdellovibrionaceae bacterium]|nr:hypothetical protein [Bdellovibrionales bacterium]MCB9083682.1 hypothetical protein [Pseudobdellovibrionaceae bacterium]
MRYSIYCWAVCLALTSFVLSGCSKKKGFRASSPEAQQPANPSDPGDGPCGPEFNIGLAWDAIQGDHQPVNFTVYYGNNSRQDVPYSHSVEVQGPTNTTTHFPVQRGLFWFFGVTATYTNGESDYSNEVSLDVLNCRSLIEKGVEPLTEVLINREGKIVFGKNQVRVVPLSQRPMKQKAGKSRPVVYQEVMARLRKSLGRQRGIE